MIMCAVWREEHTLFGYTGGEYSSTDPVTTQKSYQIGLRSKHKRNWIKFC